MNTSCNRARGVKGERVQMWTAFAIVLLPQYYALPTTYWSCAISPGEYCHIDSGPKMLCL
jgi:hypothetical protein